MVMKLFKQLHNSRITYSLNICFSSQFDNASKLTWYHINKKTKLNNRIILVLNFKIDLDPCLTVYWHVQNNIKETYLLDFW